MKSDEREEESRWVPMNLLNEEDEQGSLTMRRRERAKSQGLGQLLAEAFSHECEGQHSNLSLSSSSRFASSCPVPHYRMHFH